VNLAVSWSNAKEMIFMRAVVRLLCRHPVTVGELPVDLRTKVRECGTNMAVELTHARFVGSRARLRSVIDEVVREEFIENIEVSPVLDLFGIPADDGFRGIGRRR
jgi:hypothetical protein